MLFFISTLHVHFLLSFDHRNVRKNIGTGNLIINKKLLLVILDPTVFRQIIKRLRIVSFQRIVLALNGDQDGIGRHQPVEGDEPQGGGAVDEQVVTPRQSAFSRLSFCLRLVVSESLSNPLKKALQIHTNSRRDRQKFRSGRCRFP